MSFNSFGRILRFSTWGESHGPAIGAVVDGCPARLPLSESDIQPDLATDTGEPIGFVDIVLIPADTTLKRVGGLTNADGTFLLDEDRPKSIGKLRGFQGNFGVFVRSYAYIRSLGAEGLQEASETAVLNANYLKALLADPEIAEQLPIAYDRTCMHEFVLSGRGAKEKLGIRTLDIAKRLLDHKVHPPTVYFPLLVDEALMIEPTETEAKETLDAFAEAIAEILREAEPQVLVTFGPEGITKHPDHTTISQAATEAFHRARTGLEESLQRLLYVAVPGIRNYVEYGGVGILVYDIDAGYRFVKRIPTFELKEGAAPENVKGIAASARTRRLYLPTPKPSSRSCSRTCSAL